MKLKLRLPIFVLLLLLFSPNSWAKSEAKNNDCCEKALEGTPEKEVPGDFERLAQFTQNDKDEQLKNLSARVCAPFILFNRFEEVITDLNSTFKKHIKKYHGIQKPTHEDIAIFLNKYGEKILCYARFGGKKINYMLMSFDIRAQDVLFKKYFGRLNRKLRKTNTSINMNLVSYTAPGNKPETVLDYIERVYVENKVFGPRFATRIG